MRTPGRRNGPVGVGHASTTSHVPRSACEPSASRITNGLWCPGDRVVKLAMKSVRFSQYRAKPSTTWSMEVQRVATRKTFVRCSASPDTLGIVPDPCSSREVEQGAH